MTPGYEKCTRCGCQRPVKELLGTKCINTEYCDRAQKELQPEVKS